MNVRKVRALMNVRRFNFERCNRYQSVAEHSFFVALIAKEMAADLGWHQFKIAAATYAALLHDAAEAVTGDLPYLVRMIIDRGEVNKLDRMAEKELDVGEGDRFPAITLGMGDLKDVNELVEAADAAELFLYLGEELDSGNEAMRPIFEETLSRLRYQTSLRLHGALMNVLGIDAAEWEEIQEVRFRGLKH